MATSPALTRKCYFPTVSCEQVLTQPFLQESMHLQHENMLCYTLCYTPLSSASRYSLQKLHLLYVTMKWRQFSLAKIHVKKKGWILIGQNLVILSGILNPWKTPPSNNKL